ncbi:MAG: sugar ABC transporter substrate-binding protein [Clostridiaceae bacterium]|nr:sugar ABC transporter substrate-binding protein [Clostridiaceae bacterium]
MKKPFIIKMIVLFLFIIFGFVYSISYLHYIENSILLIIDNESKKQVKNPEYHFMVICHNMDDPYWKLIREGVWQASQDFNVAVELNGPQFTNADEELKYLDIAIASKVDGIATHVLNENQFRPLINKAVNLGIPVVTIVSDAEKSKRQAFVGTNSYKLGTEGGKLIAKATNGKAKVAVILNDYGDISGSAAQDLNFSGFKDEIKSYPDIEIVEIKSSEVGVLGAEEVTQDILNRYPMVNAIYCTQAKYTLGAAQVVVDMNKVGEIVIVGYGELPEILRYVENGVIYGTLVGDIRKIGYESIKSLVEIKKTGRTSSYVDTGVCVITRENIANYQDQWTVRGYRDNEN